MAVPITDDEAKICEDITRKMVKLINDMYDHELSDEEADIKSNELDELVKDIYALKSKAPSYLLTLWKNTGTAINGGKIPVDFMLTLMMNYVLHLYKYDRVIIKDVLIPDRLKQGQENDS